jgi:hypothetical protein
VAIANPAIDLVEPRILKNLGGVFVLEQRRIFRRDEITSPGQHQRFAARSLADGGNVAAPTH